MNVGATRAVDHIIVIDQGHTHTVLFSSLFLITKLGISNLCYHAYSVSLCSTRHYLLMSQ